VRTNRDDIRKIMRHRIGAGPRGQRGGFAREPLDDNQAVLRGV
jgi:hypothetical protein